MSARWWVEGHAPGWVRSVPVAEIDRQRQLAWPDFHPEDFCHRCGNRNCWSWSVDHDEWATAGFPPSEIVCPVCFTEQHAEAAGSPQTWVLSPAPPSDFERLLTVLDRADGARKRRAELAERYPPLAPYLRPSADKEAE